MEDHAVGRRPVKLQVDEVTRGIVFVLADILGFPKIVLRPGVAVGLDVGWLDFVETAPSEDIQRVLDQLRWVVSVLCPASRVRELLGETPS